MGPRLFEASLGRRFRCGTEVRNTSPPRRVRIAFAYTTSLKIPLGTRPLIEAFLSIR